MNGWNGSEGRILVIGEVVCVCREDCWSEEEEESGAVTRGRAAAGCVVS